MVHQEVHHCLRYTKTSRRRRSDISRKGDLRSQLWWRSHTCPGCFSSQSGSMIWWASRWPHSLSAPELSTSWIPEQAGEGQKKKTTKKPKTEWQQDLHDTCTCEFTAPTTSSRLTAWLFSGLDGKGACAAALSSPFFNMPLQFPMPPSVCSPRGPPAAAYRGDRDSEQGGGAAGLGYVLRPKQQLKKRFTPKLTK